MTYHLNIGSNTGDRTAIIGSAVALISSMPETVGTRVSSQIESEPWGFESDNRFINVGVEIECDLEPEQLLDRLNDIERQLGATPHRDDSGNYIDRNIDIDIICADDMIVETPRLTLPHPRLHQRMFVLQPLSELSPGWRHPLTGLTAFEMINILLSK